MKFGFDWPSGFREEEHGYTISSPCEPEGSDDLKMCRVMRKPVFGVSVQFQNKLGCTATENGKKLEILDL